MKLGYIIIGNIVHFSHYMTSVANQCKRLNYCAILKKYSVYAVVSHFARMVQLYPYCG